MTRSTLRALRLLFLAAFLATPLAAGAETATAPAATKSGPAKATPAKTEAPKADPAKGAEPAKTDAAKPAAGEGAASKPAGGETVPAKPAPAKNLVPVKADEIQGKLDAWKTEIEQIAAGIAREGQTDRHLAELRERAERIRTQTTEIAAAEAPRLASFDARLKQLGPAPQAKDDEPAPVESEAVKTERDEQLRLQADSQGRVKQAQLLALRAEEIIKTIGDRRRDRFTRELVERSRSVLDPSMWLEALQSMPGTVNGLRYLIGDWMSLLASRGVETSIAVGSVIVALFALLFGLRRRLVIIADRDPDLVDPPVLRKAAVAAGIVALNLVIPLSCLIGAAWALETFDLARDRVLQFIGAVTAGVGAAAAIYSVALALFAPAKPHWRLVAIDDVTATRIVGLSVVLSITHGLGVAIGRLMGVLAAPVAEVIAVSGLFVVIDAVVVMAALRATARAFTIQEAGADGVEGQRRSIVWRWIVPLGWVVVIAAVVAAIVGYVALGSFLTTQLVRTGFFLGALYILLLLVDELILATFHERTRFGVLLTRSMGFGRETVEQIGVVLSGVARLFLIAATALLILTPIGLDSQDVVSDARLAFFGFKIGGLTFSLSAVLSGLAFLMLGIAVTRGIQGWLDERLLPRTRLDVGLKNSIRTAFGYVGYVLAVMLAFSVVGLDLQNLAIVAGALSVGIGFGLQSIVNNFVSGLILLVERPIKAGDLVEIGAEKGFIRKINVRSTEIETFDRASLIVPNSSLISGNVKNWMHRDLTGRCVVNVGVAYDADPEVVRRVLLDCAEAHEKVLSFPMPNAFFVNFGDSALEFRLVCTVGNVTDAFGVESDLRFAIVARLREAGIDIPYAQRDIHIRQLEGLGDVMGAFLAARGATPQDPGPQGGA